MQQSFYDNHGEIEQVSFKKPSSKRKKRKKARGERQHKHCATSRCEPTFLVSDVFSSHTRGSLLQRALDTELRLLEFVTRRVLDLKLLHGLRQLSLDLGLG